MCPVHKYVFCEFLFASLYLHVSGILLISLTFITMFPVQNGEVSLWICVFFDNSYALLYGFMFSCVSFHFRFALMHFLCVFIFPSEFVSVLCNVCLNLKCVLVKITF